VEQKERNSPPINYILAILTMAISLVGLWLARSILVGTVIILPTIVTYSADLLAGPRPENVPGFRDVVSILPTMAAIFGSALAAVVAFYSVNIAIGALNAIRILTGEGEAVKGIVIKLPFSAKAITPKPAAEQKETD
jgi:hypothetical protein